MATFFITAGSFTIVSLTVWLLLSILLVSVFPLLERLLFNCHPVIASTLCLLFFSVPFLASLTSSILLFSPVTENALIDSHCHDNCAPHAPLFDSVLPAVLGLIVFLLVMVFLSRRLYRNITLSTQLQRRLLSISDPANGCYHIADSKPLVFTLGWWKSHIFITEGLLAHCSRQDIDIILEHEKAHVLRRDNVRLLLGRMFLFLIPKNYSDRLFSSLQLFSEAACDLLAARKFSRLEIAETLLKIQKLIPKPDIAHGRVAFTGSEVEHRIKFLLRVSGDSANSYLLTSACAVLALLSIAFLLDPLHHLLELIFHI